MIDKIKTYVRTNQESLKRLQNYQPTNDRWIGTVDVATARLNTIVLYLANHPLLLDKHMEEIKGCQQAIENFTTSIDRYYNSSKFYRWWPLALIFWFGKRQIPRIKKLLNTIDAY